MHCQGQKIQLLTFIFLKPACFLQKQGAFLTERLGLFYIDRHNTLISFCLTGVRFDSLQAQVYSFC